MTALLLVTTLTACGYGGIDRSYPRFSMGGTQEDQDASWMQKDVPVPAEQIASDNPAALAQLSPAAGLRSSAGHENDLSATQLKAVENRRAIETNEYRPLWLERRIPSDY